MKLQKTADVPSESKSQNLSRFKGALKHIRSRIKNRIMPIVMCSLLAFSPAAFAKDIQKNEKAKAAMEQIEKSHPGIMGFEILEHIIMKSLKDTTDDELLFNLKKQILENHENAIYNIALDAVLREVLGENTSRYLIGATKSLIKISHSDSFNGSEEGLIIVPEGDNGVLIRIVSREGEETSVRITSQSKWDDVGTLRLSCAKFFGTLLPTLVMIGKELDER